jgi:hypothetical protein
MGEAVEEEMELVPLAGDPGQPMIPVVYHQRQQAIRVAGFVHDGREWLSQVGTRCRW